MFQSLLANARQGDFDAIGRILEHCRDYLMLIANQDLDQDVKRKIGASDLVQESMMTAQAQFHQFNGNTEAQFLGWLRGVLLNDVRHWRRHYKGTLKRNLHRETVLDDSPATAQEPRDQWYTPSSQVAAEEEEKLLANALAALPENYQRVIDLRNWQEKSFPEIGEEMQCSSEAARKLWSRAILKLQESLTQEWPEIHPEVALSS